MASLARPNNVAADYNKPPSLTRTLQLVESLEVSLHSLFGAGVVSGGRITKTTGFGCRVASGSVFFAEGRLLTLSANQDYTVSGTPTVYLWGRVRRTSADQTLPTALDTFDLLLDHNTTGTAPSVTHAGVEGNIVLASFPLAVISTTGAGINGINDVPEGKFVRLLGPLSRRKLTIATADGDVIAADEQYLAHKLTINGMLGVNGILKFV